MPALMVDGIAVTVPAGASVLDAILTAGVRIPHLCKDDHQHALGTCRSCLVELAGSRGQRASCTTPAREGMVVHTDSADLRRVRRGILQLTLDMLAEDDPVRLGELADLVAEYDLVPGRFRHDDPHLADLTVDASNPVWLLDHRRCILCQRCIVACQEVQQIGAIALLERGERAVIGTFDHGPIAASNCTSCGQCWSVCPTTAIRLREPVAYSGGARDD